MPKCLARISKLLYNITNERNTTMTTPQTPCRANNFQSGRRSAYEISCAYKNDKQLAWIKGQIGVQWLYAKTPKDLDRLYWQMEIVEKEIARRAK